MTTPEPPHNLDAEAAVLASVLINREAIVPIAPWLRPAHFYLEKHGRIFEAMLACYAARTSPTIATIVTELRKTDRLEGIGGIGYLAELSDAVPSSYDVEAHAREVERCAILRALASAGGRIAAIGYDHSKSAEQARADAQAALNAVQIGGAADVFQPIGVAVDAYYEKLRRVSNGDATALGIQSSYTDLDAMTGGLHDDELTIVAARPAVGKTSFMLSLAFNIAKRDESDLLIASLEMSRDQLLVRLLAMETKIDTHALRLMQLSEADMDRVLEALGRINEYPIYIADISAMTAEQIRLATLRHIAKRDRKCVPFVDYLQLMGSTRARENRVQDVSDISRGLKNLARELHVPVIALSQLSRAVESRQSKVPMLSDLRESGSREQDADNVWFIYREDLYEPNTDKKGIAELHIAKHRQGPIGVIPMQFDPATTRFESLDKWHTAEGY